MTGTLDMQFSKASAYESSKCCAGAKTALVKDFLKPLRHLPAADDFLEFLMHKDGRHIPVSLEAFDEVISSCVLCYVFYGKQVIF